jgi:hypothetical protein
MTKKLVGLVASVALLGSGMALAEDQSKNQQTQQQGQLGGDTFGGSGQQGQTGGEALGGSGQQDQMGGQHGQMGGQYGQTGSQHGQMGEKQITGTVVKSSSNMLHLRTDNGIIPVKVNKDTQFQDPNVKRVRDLKEGQQVRASFDIQGTDNVAKSISLETGTGGSMMDDKGINQDFGGSGKGDQDVGKEKGQGGSGMDRDLGGDIRGDVGGDVGSSGQRGDKSY